MDKVILVTGANGFVGRHVIQRLAQDVQLKIVATDIHENMVSLSDQTRGVIYVSGDVSSKAFVDSLAATHHFDSIIHLAAVISQTPDSNTYLSIVNSNVHATFLLLEMAKAHDARFIFPSTALVYGVQECPFREEMVPDPGDFYALSKQMCEQLIRFYTSRYRVASVIFRIGILYGPSQTVKMFIPWIIGSLFAGEEFPMTLGEQKRDFVYIGDLVEALGMVLARPEVTGTYNIGSGSAPSMKDVAALVEELTGIAGKVKIGALPYREREVWDYRLDNSKARETFGWTPGTPLREGLTRTIRYHLSTKQASA